MRPGLRLASLLAAGLAAAVPAGAQPVVPVVGVPGDVSAGLLALAAAAATLYLPFLLLIIVGRVIALAAAGLTAVLAGLALAPLSQSAWEPGYLWAAAIQAVTAVLAAVLLLAAVDYALVRLEAGRSPGASGSGWVPCSGLWRLCWQTRFRCLDPSWLSRLRFL